MSTGHVRPIRRLLVANRGEIALRIMRACREMDIAPIAVYGEGEESAPHVRYADEAHRLSTESGIPYLDIHAVVGAARACNADAVHPGYGFLAENAEFARAVSAAGLIFIGPSPEAIAAMGDKVEARRIAASAGVPMVAGTMDPVATVDEAQSIAEDIGYPVAVKAVGGGGGRGFRVARTSDEIEAAFTGSRGEAERYFANPAVYLERYLEHPRHIEIQVFADTHGNVVSLGERDCSIQRRHQKLIEEAPSPAVDASLRVRLGESAIALARAVDYVGAGTVEFLLDATGTYAFLEMNTRIQVEHTVTEMVTGIDLVREQIAVAMGHPLSFTADDVRPRGSAIECRINAEDAGRDFAPTPAQVERYREPAGLGIRVDSALAQGDAVMPQFDSMIAKLLAWGRTREEAISRMMRALGDFEIRGPATTIPFHLSVMEHGDFRDGGATTTFLTDHPEVLPIASRAEPIVAGDDKREPVRMIVEVNSRRFETVVHGAPIGSPNGVAPSRRKRPGAADGRGRGSLTGGGDDLTSPIQGTVIRVPVEEGTTVESGQVICVVEAMKMENELVAHKSGTLTELAAAVGNTVSIGQVIATIVSA